LLRQIHCYPKLIANKAHATCTDTIHRVRFTDRRESGRVVAAFLNSLTFAYAEIMGRSYGGGVLELEPNEADNLPIPLAGGEMLDLREADRALRRSDDISTVLDRHDAVILVDGLGLDSSDVKTLRGIWAKLRDRRIGRKL
jgi:adenine-specific DNA methylase